WRSRRRSPTSPGPGSPTGSASAAPTSAPPRPARTGGWCRSSATPSPPR
ncbi:MAG: putative secreted protein, partial [uncultured Pseudonocardia sp.]